jgi:hypothetical protein
MNKNRIAFVIDRLIAIAENPKHQFKLEAWTEEVKCGFSGCVIGWAAYERWFEPEGIRFEVKLHGHTGIVNIYERDGHGWIPAPCANVAKTFADHLGISKEAAEKIIFPEAYEEAARDIPVPIEKVIWRLMFILSNGDEAMVDHFKIEIEDDVVVDPVNEDA